MKNAHYDYLTFELERGRTAFAAFAGAVQNTGAIKAAGGEVLGVFAPQLGFASNEAAVLIRWPQGKKASLDAITKMPQVLGFSHERLSATARPDDHDLPREGGIYVHRWFTIDGDRIEDFVDMSDRAWVGFEANFDAKIFGLFLAEQSDKDRKTGERRLFLLTNYANHGVWEASREPTREEGGLFLKRHELTRSTIGRSTLLIRR